MRFHVRRIDSNNAAGALSGDVKHVGELTARCDPVNCAVSSTMEAPKWLHHRTALRYEPVGPARRPWLQHVELLAAPPWIGSRKLAPLESAGAIQKFGSTVSIILRR
jgi:hypothetical protein